jgi:hypothetical protein
MTLAIIPIKQAGDKMNSDTIINAALNSTTDSKVKTELESIMIYPGYIEPGYENEGIRAVALGNWNGHIMARVKLCLERSGYACEWSDSWSCCDDCAMLLRVEGLGYNWEPSYIMNQSEGTFKCKECSERD